MKPSAPLDGKCPQPDRQEPCNLVCKYNHFEADDLVIDSWELKCLDCGYRKTIAYRSDEEECEPNPTICPFCKLDGLKPGQNPCEKMEQGSKG